MPERETERQAGRQAGRIVGRQAQIDAPPKEKQVSWGEVSN